MRYFVAMLVACLWSNVPGFVLAQYPQQAPTVSYYDFGHEATFITADIGTIGLIRETPDSQVIAEDQNFVPLLNANELQGSMQFGFCTQVKFHNVKSWLGGTDLQFGYFGVNSLDAETTIGAASVSPIFFNSVPVNPISTSNISYSSNIYSGEANFVFASNRWIRPIVGLRYFRLEDSYDAFNFTSGIRKGGFSETNNSLFGGQIGIEFDKWFTPQWGIYGFGKFAAMNNDVEGYATAADPNDIVVVKNYSDSSYTSLVDGGAGLRIDYAGPLSFKIGYRGIFASKLATGIDQNAAIPLLIPGSTVAFNSQYWHGIDLAAIFAF